MALALNKVMSLIANIEPVEAAQLKLNADRNGDNGNEKFNSSNETEGARNGPRLQQTFPVMLEEKQTG